MKIVELEGKRCLMLVTGSRYSRSQAVEEYRVLEASPSRNWVRLMNVYGNKFWKPVAEVSLVEVLQELVPCRREEASDG